MDEEGFRIGVSEIDITPPIGTLMMGYKPRVSNGVGHRLRAEALLCRSADGKDGWLLITSDVIGYRNDYVNEIRGLISKAIGLPPESIMISATHTHSGPATTQFGGEELSELDRNYLAQLNDKLVELAVSANDWATADNLSNFEVAWTEAPDLASNRRIRNVQGEWTNEWQDPFGAHPGYFDPTIMLLAVRNELEEMPDALVVNYGVHPVTLGPGSLKISADWPGYMKDMLQACGETRTAIFANAGAGNINPRSCIGRGAELPRKMGEAVAEAVIAATRKLWPIDGDRVTSHSEPWEIIRTRDAMKAGNRPGRNKGDKIKSEIQVLRAGDLCIVGLPGELFSEYSRMIREAGPLPHTMVVSLANDYIGYLPTDEAQTQGAYETNMCPAERIEQSLMDCASRAMAAVVAGDPKPAPAKKKSAGAKKTTKKK